MAKQYFKFVAFGLAITLLLSACNPNFYSGTGKGGRGCGCPSHKGMSGY